VRRGDELVDKAMETEIRDRLILTRMMKNDNWSYMDAELEHVRSALADLNYGACAMGKVLRGDDGFVGIARVQRPNSFLAPCRARTAGVSKRETGAENTPVG